jgi:hypothetical protein
VESGSDGVARILSCGGQFRHGNTKTVVIKHHERDRETQLTLMTSKTREGIRFGSEMNNENEVFSRD